MKAWLVSALLATMFFCRATVGGEIHEAAKYGDELKAATLLRANPHLVNTKAAFEGSPVWTPLQFAAWFGHRDLASLFLSHKANVNAKDNTGFTPLHLAATMRRLDVVELLLANKADVNARNDNGDTPLHIAAAGMAHRTTVELVKLLLAHGADVNAENNDGCTPVCSAEGAKLPEVAELLRQHGGK